MLERSGQEFTCGCAYFEDRDPDVRESSAKIFVRVRFESLPVAHLAQLDTGAAWSVLDRETAEALDLLSQPGAPATLGTRLGRFRGKLVKVGCSLLADQGEALDTEGTFFVPEPGEDWPPGVCFLGYSGFLDGIRFAVDAQENLFYFGPSGEP